MDNLPIKLQPFIERPFLFAIRFKPSVYEEVFHLCVNHLNESFDKLKASNFEVSHRPGEPSAEFYHSVDMLDHLLKSIMDVPRFPWKAPTVWLSIAILYFLFRDPYSPLLWCLVLVEAILMIWSTWAQNNA